MNTYLKIFIKEIIWLLLIVFLSWPLTNVVFKELNGGTAWETTYSSDGFFTLKNHLYLFIVAFLIFFLYNLKQFKIHFKIPIQNILIIFSGIAFSIQLNFIIDFFNLSAGGTLYPPLSNLKSEEKISPDNTVNAIIVFIYILQILAISLCIFAAYKTVKNQLLYRHKLK